MITDLLYEKHIIDRFLEVQSLNQQWMEESPDYKPDHKYWFKEGGEKASEYWRKRHQEELRVKNLEIHDLKYELYLLKAKFALSMDALQIIKEKASQVDERLGEDKGLYTAIIHNTLYQIGKIK